MRNLPFIWKISTVFFSKVQRKKTLFLDNKLELINMKQKVPFMFHLSKDKNTCVFTSQALTTRDKKERCLIIFLSAFITTTHKIKELLKTIFKIIFLIVYGCGFPSESLMRQICKLYLLWLPKSSYHTCSTMLPEGSKCPRRVFNCFYGETEGQLSKNGSKVSLCKTSR